jgi:predicted DNA-binding transcriptional regulator YafY
MVEMTFLTEYIEGFVRWMMMYGDTAVIVSPEELRTKVRDLSNVIMLRNS